MVGVVLSKLLIPTPNLESFKPGIIKPLQHLLSHVVLVCIGFKKKGGDSTTSCKAHFFQLSTEGWNFLCLYVWHLYEITKVLMDKADVTLFGKVRALRGLKPEPPNSKKLFLLLWVK